MLLKRLALKQPAFCSIALVFAIAVACSHTDGEGSSAVNAAAGAGGVPAATDSGGAGSPGASGVAEVVGGAESRTGDLSGAAGELAAAGMAGAQGGETSGITAGGRIFHCDIRPAASDFKRCTSAPQFIGQLGSGPVLSEIESGAIDALKGRLLLFGKTSDIDAQSRTLLSVNLTSGNRSVVSGWDPVAHTLVGDGPTFDSVAALAVHPSGTAFINDGDLLMSVDPASGARAIVRNWNDRWDSVNNVPKDACRYVQQKFAIDADGLFHFVYESGNQAYRAGWARYDLSTDNCDAYSRCPAQLNGMFGKGPCPSGLVVVHPYQGRVYSTEFVSSSLFAADLSTGDRTRVTREANDTSTNVGAGTGCMREDGTIASFAGAIWLTGDMPYPDACDPGQLAVTRVDLPSGDRTPALITAGPLKGSAGLGSDLMIFAHPSLDVLIVVADNGVALYDPETGESVYVSR